MLLWTLLILLAGLAASPYVVRDPYRLTTPERIAWAFVLGSVFYSLIGLSLYGLGLFSWWWAAIPVTVFLAFRGRVWRGLSRSNRGASLFWALVLVVAAVEATMSWATVDYGFGQDVYFWAGIARQIAIRGGGDLVPPLLSPAPAGYGFLLATAASVVPDVHHNAAVVSLIFVWTVFAACGGYALASRLCGSQLGAAVTVVYLGSYWCLYFLVPAVSRQAWALGVAPLLLLVLVRKGYRAFSSLELYVLLGAAWLLHAFTALVMLCLLPPILFQAGRRIGWRELERRLGPLGILGALVVLAPPLVVLGRLFLGIPGIVRFIEHPLFYVMKPIDPWELLRTLGPVTLVVLALGLVSLRKGFAGARGRARLLGLWLVFLLLSIGLFHQIWYRSASVALPPHRYYLFFSLVVLAWSADLGRWFPARWSRAGVYALSGVAVVQLGFHAVFVARMLTPMVEVFPVLEAAKWMDANASIDDTVAVAIRAPDKAAQLRSLVSPRSVRMVSPDESWGDVLPVVGVDSRVTFVVTDRPDLPNGATIRFQQGSPPVTVLEVRPAGAVRSEATPVLIFASVAEGGLLDHTRRSMRDKKIYLGDACAR